jgi:hypothetical protein
MLDKIEPKYLNNLYHVDTRKPGGDDLFLWLDGDFFTQREETKRFHFSRNYLNNLKRALANYDAFQNITNTNHVIEVLKQLEIDKTFGLGRKARYRLNETLFKLAYKYSPLLLEFLRLPLMFKEPWRGSRIRGNDEQYAHFFGSHSPLVNQCSFYGSYEARLRSCYELSCEILNNPNFEWSKFAKVWGKADFPAIESINNMDAQKNVLIRIKQELSRELELLAMTKEKLNALAAIYQAVRSNRSLYLYDRPIKPTMDKLAFYFMKFYCARPKLGAADRIGQTLEMSKSKAVAFINHLYVHTLERHQQCLREILSSYQKHLMIDGGAGKLKKICRIEKYCGKILLPTVSFNEFKELSLRIMYDKTLRAPRSHLNFWGQLKTKFFRGKNIYFRAHVVKKVGDLLTVAEQDCLERED